jgi:thioredoxin-dependent peroxiredoxin
MRVKVGGRAPEFSLPAQDGSQVTLQDLTGKGPVVVYFYPMDNTPGCTAQACFFRDSYVAFQEAGAEVIGISSQSTQSHVGFAEKHNLPFKLLSDEGGKVRESYGVPKSFGLLPGRTTFVIDRHGIVRHVFDSQLRIGRHVQEALAVIKRITSGVPQSASA